MKKYILNRPVNALKKGYEPALLGAKIRARKPTEMQVAIIEKSVEKKLNSSEDWNYKSYFSFKGIDDSGKLEYRECLSPSPSASSAEAFLINQFAEIAKDLFPDNVYSYRLAKRNASANYKYFLSEYEARNQDILSRLDSSHNLVAVFFDIEKFYPSVKFDLMKSKLLKFSESIKDRFNLSPFVNFSLNQLSKSPSGIPVGTELSHLLANIFLSDFDKTLREKYGDRFFRYVDDITIVCEKNQIESVRNEVNSLISGLDLIPNIKKAETYNISQWRTEIKTAPIEGDDFFNYCKNLEGWIKINQNSVETVRRNLRDEGFHIPLEKIVARNSPTWALPNKELRLKDIVSESKRLRESYRNAAMDLASMTLDQHSRGTLQRARRALNPLFYLLDPSEYGVISDVADSHPKLSVQKEVSVAVMQNDCSKLINYPGTTISSYCEIWKTVKGANISAPKIDMNSEFKNHQLDSLLSLSLHNVVKVDPSLKSGAIWIALRDNVTMRSNDLTGFENELESLRINLSKTAQDELLGRRETDDEDIDMQALDLGSQMISS